MRIDCSAESVGECFETVAQDFDIDVLVHYDSAWSAEWVDLVYKEFDFA